MRNTLGMILKFWSYWSDGLNVKAAFCVNLILPTFSRQKFLDEQARVPTLF